MEQNLLIQDNIYYVGVNDRTKDLFENMWPLPYGISYNSYLLVDKDMVTLIDTVDISFFSIFLKKIRGIIGDRKINYLVINHMEPDHSGAIALIRQYYPDIVIVGNKLTFGMIEGYYGVKGNNYLIADGDCIDLGYHKLRFYITPMVHWPETMMTFDEATGILFSGDAFGSFGALNGSFLDTKIDTSLFQDEMERYYSNIIGKYGLPVQKALNKLRDVPVKILCSTHGPVWTGDNVQKVVATYNRLSLYEAEENGVVIAYASMYGNTIILAETIAAELAEKGVKTIKMYDVSKTNASYILRDIFKYKGLIVGCPTYNGQIYPDMESLLSKIAIREIKNRYFCYFGSFTWASAAVKRMTKWAEATHLDLIGCPVEMKQAMNNITRDKAIELADEMAARLLNK
jgi:flavorubredoxin